MLKHVELDPTFGLRDQYADDSGKTTILINLFDVDPSDRAAFLQAWLTDATFFAAQPGYISAQLHEGIGGSRLFMNYAVFDSTASFAATNERPEFGPLRAVYPDSATAHPHLFRRLHVPDICVGEGDGGSDARVEPQPTGLGFGELDPSYSLRRQYDDDSGATTILVNLFDVDPADDAYFQAAWREDAEFFKRQPGYVSAQLHRGIGGSRKYLNYAVFENTASFAATNDQPEFGPLRRIYPDSAVAHPHLFRRLSIQEICVGDAAGWPAAA